MREANRTRAAYAQQRVEEQQQKEQCRQELASSHSSAVDAAMQDTQSHNHIPASAETVAVKPVAKTESIDWVSFQATKPGSVSAISLLDAGAEGSDSPRITTSMSAVTASITQDPCNEPIMLKATHTALEDIMKKSSTEAEAMDDNVSTVAGASHEPVHVLTEVNTKTSSLTSAGPLGLEQPATESQQPQSADAAVNRVAASSVEHEPAVEQMAVGNASMVDSNPPVSVAHAQGAPTLSSTEIFMVLDHTSAPTEDGGDASQGGKVKLSTVRETPAVEQAVADDAMPSAAAKLPEAGDMIFEKAEEVDPIRNRREVNQQSTDAADVTAQHTQVRKGFCFKLACWHVIEL